MAEVFRTVEGSIAGNGGSKGVTTGRSNDDGANNRTREFLLALIMTMRFVGNTAYR